MQGIALAQDVEGLDGGAHYHGRQTIGEQIGTAALTQHVDNLLATRGEATHRTAEGLAQGACVDVHTPVGIEKLTHAAACLAHNACRVALVHHHQGVIFLCQVANLVHRSHIAVHREHAVGDDDAEALLLSRLELFLQVRHVGIGIAIALCLAQAHAVDDAGVVQGIADDGILVGEQRLEHTAVGIEAGGIKNGVVGMEKLADSLLQLLVDVLRAADEAH